MPSKYSRKKAKPITRQGDEGRYRPTVRPTCTNCGTASSITKPTHSKCRCGGTYQTYKGLIE